MSLCNYRFNLTKAIKKWHPTLTSFLGHIKHLPSFVINFTWISLYSTETSSTVPMYQPASYMHATYIPGLKHGILMVNSFTISNRNA